jgi:hypothetical protein
VHVGTPDTVGVSPYVQQVPVGVRLWMPVVEGMGVLVSAMGVLVATGGSVGSGGSVLVGLGGGLCVLDGWGVFVGGLSTSPWASITPVKKMG